MRRALLFLLSASAAWSHVMSMSSGDLIVEGSHARYQLRMPLYEISHVANPEQALLEHIRFAGARLVKHECHADPARDAYLCTAEYEWPSPVDRVDAECTFPAVTVPNHVHLLRAQMGDKRDEAVFDLAFTRATLRFRPPSRTEIVITQAGAGFLRALSGAVQVLFLVALVLAARSRAELLAMAGTFLAGQIASVALLPYTGFQPAPRFVEAAAALTIAYLAVEMLALPKSGARWAIAGILGVFHGLYFHLFLSTTGYSAPLVLTGAALAEGGALAVFGLLFWRLRRWTRVLAWALLVVGFGWFLLSLRA